MEILAILGLIFGILIIVISFLFRDKIANLSSFIVTFLTILTIFIFMPLVFKFGSVLILGITSFSWSHSLSQYIYNQLTK